MAKLYAPRKKGDEQVQVGDVLKPAGADEEMAVVRVTDEHIIYASLDRPDTQGSGGKDFVATPKTGRIAGKGTK